MTHRFPQHEEWSAGFAKRLRNTDGPEPEVPASVDEAVRGAARSRLGTGRRRLIGWRTAGGLAAAASLLVAAVAWMSSLRAPAPSPRSQVVAHDDANADGVVDILDALAIARREGGDADAEALAMRLVRLDGDAG